MNVTHLTRDEWGADASLPHRGYTHDRSGVPVLERKTDLIIHHTVMVDNDSTKNVWETLDEVKVQMRRLQTIRPDLGIDVPYNEVWFLMDDFTMIACEGRGVGRTGAHTHGFNTIGLGVAFQANFQIVGLPHPFELWTPSIEARVRQLRAEVPNLVTVGGHWEYPNQSTVCPGAYLRHPNRLDQIKAMVGGDDMVLAEENRERMNRASVMLKLTSIAQAGAKPTGLELWWARAVLDAMEAK